MEARLEAWDAKIEELAAKADGARGRARIDLHYCVDDLKVKRAMAGVLLDELKSARNGAREGIRAGLEIAWNDLETTLRGLGL
ncbi:MAG: coiled coil domain-containing protein [Candidatus Latescibacterota bacterium]|nr:MAG: coiled coil domain-containing protein [Candidatus Latescibacterota bacterium]